MICVGKNTHLDLSCLAILRCIVFSQSDASSLWKAKEIDLDQDITYISKHGCKTKTRASDVQTGGNDMKNFNLQESKALSSPRFSNVDINNLKWNKKWKIYAGLHYFQIHSQQANLISKQQRIRNKAEIAIYFFFVFTWNKNYRHTDTCMQPHMRTHAHRGLCKKARGE